MVLKRCSSERGEREKRFYGSNQNAEFVKVPLRVVKVPPAAPERSAGYDASLGCPGAGPLLPGAPAIRRNSVTEAQLHRAVARRARGVPSHGQHLWTHRQTSFPTHYRLRRNGRGAPQAAKRLLLGSLSGRMYTA